MLHLGVKLVVLLLFSSMVHVAQARVATYQDAEAEIQDYSCHIDISPNGDHIEDFSIIRKILNEQGRAIFGTSSMQYDGATQKILSVSGKTVNDKKEYIVKKSMIQDMNFNLSSDGFSEWRKIMFAYPNVFVGSSVHYNCRIKNKFTIPNHYSAEYKLMSEHINAGKLLLESRIPFKFKLNDPDNVLEVTEQKVGQKHRLHIKLKKPVFYSFRDESRDSVYDPNQLPGVQISTFTSFDQLAKAIEPNFESVISDPLPNAIESIKNEALKIVALEDRINFILSRLHKTIRYMGDWRTVNGKFSPQKFDKVLEKAYGDCKDFSSLVVAILRSMGYKAHVALVMAGERQIQPIDPLPSVSLFNHAIVYLLHKDSDHEGNELKEYWIDPTVSVFYGLNINSYIRGRVAMVLGSSSNSSAYNSSLKFINNIDPSDSVFQIDMEVVLDKSNSTLKHSGKCFVIGNAAYNMASIYLDESKSTADNILLNRLSNGYNVHNIEANLSGLDYVDRVIQGKISVNFSFAQHGGLRQTNFGQMFSLWYPSVLGEYLESILSIPHHQSSPFFVGSICTFKCNRYFKNAVHIISSKNSPNFKVTSPWIDVSRKCINVNGGVRVEDVVSIKKTFIMPQEIQSPEFAKLSQQLGDSIQALLLIAQ